MQRPTAFLRPGITFHFIRDERLEHSSFVAWNLPHPVLSQSPQWTHTLCKSWIYTQFPMKKMLRIREFMTGFLLFTFFSQINFSFILQLYSCWAGWLWWLSFCTRMIFGHPLHLELCWLSHNTRKVAKILRDTRDFHFCYFKEKLNSSKKPQHLRKGQGHF